MPAYSFPRILRCRVVVLGSSAVGKTALVDMLINDGTSFPKNYTMTTGIDLKMKLIAIPDSQDTVELLFVDCCGKPAYAELLKKAIPTSSIICLVYDVTNPASFNAIKSLVEFSQAFALKGIPVFLLANKLDLTNRRYVTEASGQELAEKLKLNYIECSARNIDVVKATFLEIASQFYRMRR